MLRYVYVSSRGSGVVPYEAHNLETPVQFRPPQTQKNEVAGVAQWFRAKSS